MFGERYPTDVRVVCVGAKIDDILAAPSDKQWMDYSVELCGGTHLTTTKEAGSFMVVSEEPVSGGTRRIVAFTGPAAEASRVEASSLQSELEAALDMEDSPALTKECARLSGKLDRLSSRIGYLTKIELRGLLEKLNEKDKSWKSTQRKQRQKLAEKHFTELAESLAADAPFAVTRLDIGLESKAFNDGFKKFSKLRKKTAILAVSNATPKVLVMASVPKKCAAADAGLSAIEWTQELYTLIDGSGGGSPAKAQAMGASASKLKDVIETAQRFASEKLGASASAK
jgi:alanyl-tRNA synthetase